MSVEDTHVMVERERYYEERAKHVRLLGEHERTQEELANAKQIIRSQPLLQDGL